MSSKTKEAAVFKALASPHRRRILDQLATGAKTTGDLERAMRPLTRFAVMQHLDVLARAELVLIRREGRQRWNHLNAVPVQRVYERWVSRLAGKGASELLALEKHLEEERDMTPEPQLIHIENEIRLKAPRERVFKAFTTEQLSWYPHTYGGDRVKGLVFEAHVGGKVYEDWGEGAGVSYGQVVYFDPPSVVATRSHLKPAITLEGWVMLEEDGDETVVKSTTTCFGAIGEEMASAIRSHGDLSLFEDNLRAWCEQGVAIGA